jgi:hypothetical protein
MNQTSGERRDIAAVRGAERIAELLINAGADIEGPTISGVGSQHPPHLAATRTQGSNMARLLVNMGRN